MVRDIEGTKYIVRPLTFWTLLVRGTRHFGFWRGGMNLRRKTRLYSAVFQSTCVAMVVVLKTSSHTWLTLLYTWNNKLWKFRLTQSPSTLLYFLVKQGVVICEIPTIVLLLSQKRESVGCVHVCVFSYFLFFKHVLLHVSIYDIPIHLNNVCEQGATYRVFC